MKKQQLVLISLSVITVLSLFFFGRTVPKTQKVATATPAIATTITTDSVLFQAKKLLPQSQIEHTAKLENAVVRGNVKQQQIDAYKQLAAFWGDTVHNHYLGAYYIGKAAKLENSEKNLTFAARILLEEVMTGAGTPLQTWQANQAKEFFENILTINPTNDSAKIAIGACYMFGNISSNPMEGILKVREIAQKDSTNVYAQIVLGLGGIKSGQFDKAIERFEKVIALQPNNLEAIFHLAETYDRKGDAINAAKWYKKAVSLIEIPEAKKEIEARIKALTK